MAIISQHKMRILRFHTIYFSLGIKSCHPVNDGLDNARDAECSKDIPNDLKHPYEQVLIDIECVLWLSI